MKRAYKVHMHKDAIMETCLPTDIIYHEILPNAARWFRGVDKKCTTLAKKCREEKKRRARASNFIARRLLFKYRSGKTKGRIKTWQSDKAPKVVDSEGRWIYDGNYSHIVAHKTLVPRNVITRSSLLVGVYHGADIWVASFIEFSEPIDDVSIRIYASYSTIYEARFYNVKTVFLTVPFGGFPLFKLPRTTEFEIYPKCGFYSAPIITHYYDVLPDDYLLDIPVIKIGMTPDSRGILGGSHYIIKDGILRSQKDENICES